ncbi:MAG TPA: AAA family ATPase [Hyphomicrobiaceae bacterium]|nr:AAA family ATPase [Hyphomicrobiaceae bacterium]
MATHDEIVAFLSTAGVVGPGQPRIFETHIAFVFVAGGRALKIKRPVKLAFLDFSTLQARHRACLSEIAVNRANAPEIYRGVIAMTREADGTLAIGGRGEPVEWAVEMAAFEDRDLLLRRTQQGPLDALLMRQTTDAIYAMHQRSVRADSVDAPAKMRAIVEEISEICRQCPDVLAAGDVDAFEGAARAACASATGLLQARVRQGAFRRCHGDLHLANIVIWKGKPTLFDALEFSDEMATVDTLYDLAFLLMDLIHHGQRAAANNVLNRYLWRSGGVLGASQDIEALALMPLYLACRGGIRAMVAATRAPSQHLQAKEREIVVQDARGYLSEAIAALAPPPPRLIAVGGLSGSGKSTLAAQLARHIGGPLGALHMRSDLERKAMMGVEETERLPGEHYTREAAQRVYERILRRSTAALKANQSVVVDAVFSKPEERERLAAMARTLAIAFDGLWLQADPQILQERVAGRRGDASDATREVVERQLQYDLGGLDWARIDAAGTPDATLKLALSALGCAANTL